MGGGTPAHIASITLYCITFHDPSHVLPLSRHSSSSPLLSLHPSLQPYTFLPPSPFPFSSFFLFHFLFHFFPHSLLLLLSLCSLSVYLLYSPLVSGKHQFLNLSSRPRSVHPCVHALRWTRFHCSLNSSLSATWKASDALSFALLVAGGGGDEAGVSAHAAACCCCCCS